MSDRDIILLLKNQPSDGLYELMAAYHPAVQALTRRILPFSPQDAEECVEDTFVKIWRTIDKVDPDTQTFKGLVLSTARNTAITRYRQLRRGQVISLELLELPGEDDIAQTVVDAQTGEELQQLLLEMGEPEREIFFRKYFLFESLRQIGSRVGLDEVQVRNKLYYGRKKLKMQLEKRGITYEAI